MDSWRISAIGIVGKYMFTCLCNNYFEMRRVVGVGLNVNTLNRPFWLKVWVPDFWTRMALVLSGEYCLEASPGPLGVKPGDLWALMGLVLSRAVLSGIALGWCLRGWIGTRGEQRKPTLCTQDPCQKPCAQHNTPFRNPTCRQIMPTRNRAILEPIQAPPTMQTLLSRSPQPWPPPPHTQTCN